MFTALPEICTIQVRRRTLGSFWGKNHSEPKRDPINCYHSFQNHYLHDVISCKVVRELQLQLSGVFGSYSFPVVAPKGRDCANFSETFARTFALFLSVSWVRNPTEMVQKKTRSDELFLSFWLGEFLGVDFPLVKSESHILRAPKLPKWPTHTKNSIALKFVVFCYRHRILLSVSTCCHFSQGKTHPDYYRGSELQPR